MVDCAPKTYAIQSPVLSWKTVRWNSQQTDIVMRSKHFNSENISDENLIAIFCSKLSMTRASSRYASKKARMVYKNAYAMPKCLSVLTIPEAPLSD
jgi:hypothetical protein